MHDNHLIQIKKNRMKKVDPRFAKFTKTKSNAAIKEGFKQEKRKYKKERAAFFDQKRKEADQLAKEGPKIEREKVSLEQMPLNKYLAHGGVCSRRDAAELIKDGKVKVNGKVVLEPGYKMNDGDEVLANGKKVFMSKNLVYILLNKPKDYITTTDDPQNRKTVLDIIKPATKERVYPVGRLDRNTSGVLLITNDGELAQKLTHPSNEVKKIYAVTLNRPLDKSDFDNILKGIVLEDGPVHVDVLAYSDANDKTQIGVEIHSGRNRIVRRIFESLGYEIKNLDRVMFAGLTKKNVERGKYRFLNEKEVRNLKYFGKENKSKRLREEEKGSKELSHTPKPFQEKEGTKTGGHRKRIYSKPINEDTTREKVREKDRGKTPFPRAKKFDAPGNKNSADDKKQDGFKPRSKAKFQSAKTGDHKPSKFGGGAAKNRPAGAKGNRKERK